MVRPSILQGLTRVALGDLHNTIITDAKTGVDATNGSAGLRNNDFFNNTTDVKNATIGASSQLVDPMLNAIFHLPAGSPMVDTGSSLLAPDHDIDGQPRPMIGTSGKAKVDVGADERTGPAP